MTENDGLSPTGKRLITIVQELANDLHDTHAPAPLSEFVQIYREWISVERGRRGTQKEQAERWQLVVHGMLSANDLAGAIDLLIRYAKIMWGGRGPCELRLEGDSAVLVFEEPFRAGPEGLIAAIWPLALTLCQLEFLAGAVLAGTFGQVPHSCCLQENMVELLFGRPLKYDQREIALVFPRHHLYRPIVARVDNLPKFFQELLPLTLGARREPLSVQSLVIGLLRDDKRGPLYRKSSFEDTAARLSMSSATLRRRLAEEGTSFRELRDSVYDELARAWLLQNEIPIEDIAARLGYSDPFAFRRFFWRTNGCSPSTFRTRVLS